MLIWCAFVLTYCLSLMCSVTVTLCAFFVTLWMNCIGYVLLSYLLLNVFFRLLDSVWATTIVWRIRGQDYENSELFRAALCITLVHNIICTHMNSSSRWLLILVLISCFCVFLIRTSLPVTVSFLCVSFVLVVARLVVSSSSADCLCFVWHATVNAAHSPLCTVTFHS